MTRPISRKDNKGRVLQKGESQRKDGLYVYRYTNGKYNVESIYASTLNELREKEKQLFRDLDDGIRVDVKNITLNDMYEKWFKTKDFLKDSTYTNYKYLYESNVKDDIGKRLLIDIKKSDIKSFYQRLSKGKNKKYKKSSTIKPRAITTVENVHNILFQIFKLAVEDDYIRKNPCDGALKEIKNSNEYKREKVTALTADELKAFMGFLKNSDKYKHWYPLFFVLANTGLRVGELCGLTWECISFENNTMSIERTLSYRMTRDGYCGFALTTPKTQNGTRVIPMTSSVKKELTELYDIHKKFNTHSKITVNGHNDFVFINKIGNPFTQKTINLALRRIQEEYDKEMKLSAGNEYIEIRKFRSHVFRHSFGSLLYAATKDVKTVQTLMGHSDIQVTMNLYVDSIKENENSAIEAFSNLIGFDN